VPTQSNAFVVLNSHYVTFMGFIAVKTNNCTMHMYMHYAASQFKLTARYCA
jgi:hypothetical protein